MFLMSVRVLEKFPRSCKTKHLIQEIQAESKGSDHTTLYLELFGRLVIQRENNFSG